MARVLLLLPTTSYRISDFLDAAANLRADVVVASETPSTLASLNPAGLLTLDFRDPAGCAQRAAELAKAHPIDAVVGVDEETAVAAAAIAATLGLPHNPVAAAQAAGNKALLRARLAQFDIPGPGYALFTRAEDPDEAGKRVRYPCVLKPTFLAASRGVIRADNPAEFTAAWRRIEAILDLPDVARRGGAAAREILVEDFLPGAEVALEGLLDEGALRVLALFDKPDPLDGPFFEETIYVTPSRLEARVQTRIADTVERAAAALGLVDGPIHAELRIHDGNAWVLELAARSIGGLCSRTLRFGTGLSLEELLLRHALRQGVEGLERESAAAGVLMIPIPRAGKYDSVDGVEQAQAVDGIVDVTISAHPGQRLVPLPEGARFLGFLFARGSNPASVEAALREAHARLKFRISGE